MYKLLVVADEMPESELLCKTLQMHVGNLCEIYEAKNEKEAMALLSNNWEIKEANGFGSVESMSNISTIETDDRRLSRVKNRMEKYIQKHYMEEISMHDAAEQMNYSEAYYCKLFKQCFGMNFTSYLAQYRIKEAKKLLVASSMSAKEIGKACGYPDPCYFTRVFKREAGCTPAEYRNRVMNEEIE